MYINDLKVGMQANYKKTANLENNKLIAEVSGDYNPIHFDNNAAQKVGFKSIIAHALFGEGLISTVLGTYLPGEGSIIISKNIKCKKPVYMGDIITATVTVLDVDLKKNRVNMEVQCKNQNDEVLIDGTVLMLVR